MNDAAIVVLASWGDVLISTCLVRALKEQQNARITYYVSSACASAIQNNPDISDLVIIPATKAQAWSVQDKVVADVKRKHKKVLTPWAGFLSRDRWLPLDGNAAPNFMWSYAHAAQSEGLTITRPLKLYLYPTIAEKVKAESFLTSLPRDANTKIIMMEISGESSQTHWNHQWTEMAIETLFRRYNGNIRVLISCGGQEPNQIAQLRLQYKTGSIERIYFLNQNSLREVSIIFNGCHIFLGVSSGTSNAVHGHQCKRGIQWFEAVNDPIWASFPLGTENKTFYYGHNPTEYCKILFDKLI